ncbi:MAG: cephalosporin hydroxylase family protein [Gammaproteobacteria bacterium]|nr:cephalosporin hydroxylase family protein [Gammaproteobacteria bacterium]MDH3750612.1 cephalosporin hydroxylase family protein [Gammaproteobacteria bacterium]MDH3803931.1 cephalosporin hydroxylase family protein [Gammaproteobacteria bacterium]
MPKRNMMVISAKAKKRCKRKKAAREPPPPAEVLRLANILYFRSHVFEHTEWMGYKAIEFPTGMWIYQELMHKLETDLLIETGTLLRGSTLFFAHMIELMGRGKVISIDIELRDGLPQHPRNEDIEGSSIATEELDQVAAASETANSVVTAPPAGPFLFSSGESASRRGRCRRRIASGNARN